MCARRRAYYAADPMTVAAVWLTFGHETKTISIPLEG